MAETLDTGLSNTVGLVFAFSMPWESDLSSPHPDRREIPCGSFQLPIMGYWYLHKILLHQNKRITEVLTFIATFNRGELE